MKQLKVPKFKSESEEADWWYANRKQVERELRAAERAGRTLSIPKVLEEQRRKSKTQAINIRLAVGDIELAKQKAQKKGIGYQTLIRMLVHDSLQNTP